MKEKMFKYFTANSTRRYLNVLDDMVDRYNNNRHSTIMMTPTMASDPKNKTIVFANLYGDQVYHRLAKPKFAVGDRVRITVKKGQFDKGYTPRWTEEVFTISQVQYTDPITYRIRDDSGEEIQGTFYELELQKTAQDIYRIEKVIRRRGNRSLVKWLGYPDSMNSWIDNKELIAL